MDGIMINGAKIEITENKLAVIEGCDGLIDYSDDFVKVKMNRMTVDISGKNLRVKRLTEDTAVIEGTIQLVKYSY